MQQLTVYGNLGKDPEEKSTKNGKKFTVFSLAVPVSSKNTMWYDVFIWDDKKENFKNLLPYLKKGSAVVIVGALKTPTIYTPPQGEPQVKLKIEPYNISFTRQPKPEQQKPEQGFREDSNLPF